MNWTHFLREFIMFSGAQNSHEHGIIIYFINKRLELDGKYCICFFQGRGKEDGEIDGENTEKSPRANSPPSNNKTEKASHYCI